MKAIGMIVALAAATLTMTPSARAQDTAAGQQVFHKCMPCHRIGPGAKNLVGPELNGLDGRHSGSVAGYNYSDANKKSGIVWNEVSFEKYIKDPRGVVPGTKMMFVGIKDEKEIHDLWAYLKQFGPDGKKK
jgi:cytochrome c